MRNINSKLVKPASAIFALSAAFLLCAGHAAADTADITIFTQEKTGKIDPNVYGMNFVGYDPATYETWTKEYYGFSDYGAGMWDPKRGCPVSEAVDLAKDAGVKLARFPGGCGSHRYDWKKAIGSNRKHFLFGIDEFLTMCGQIGARAVITLSFLTGTEQDAADLVEYLNAPADGSNPRGGIDWAKERAKNGRIEPYNVAFFEVGNEDWHGDHIKIKHVAARDYAARYLRYFNAIKEADPQAQVGAILYVPEWNRDVLSRIKDRIDFGVVHPYPSALLDYNTLATMTPEDSFQLTLANIPLVYEPYFQKMLGVIREYAGKDVPLAVTEYNVGFDQSKPVPLRHTLGAALVNAEFLRVLMNPGNNIAMANHWEFSNSHWGMVYSTDDFQRHDYSLPIKYVRRPNFFVYELYAKHFGRELLKVEVNCPSYTVRSLNVPEKKKNVLQMIKQAVRENEYPDCDIDARVPYLSVNASKDEQSNTVYVIVVNKNMHKPMQTMLKLEDFDAQPEVHAWILKADQVTAMNENNTENVTITQAQFKTAGNETLIEFPPHSITALEFRGHNT
ncbi:MAG: alpha-L-arabinofuranosidase C-terminal domain-containing protein [Candidatus Omnitrophota bacterium]